MACGILHMSQGLRVVNIVAPRYAFAGSRPEFCNAAVSPYRQTFITNLILSVRTCSREESDSLIEHAGYGHCPAICHL
jgi:hypothetical protein